MSAISPETSRIICSFISSSARCDDAVSSAAEAPDDCLSYAKSRKIRNWLHCIRTLSSCPPTASFARPQVTPLVCSSWIRCCRAQDVHLQDADILKSDQDELTKGPDLYCNLALFTSFSKSAFCFNPDSTTSPLRPQGLCLNWNYFPKYLFFKN